MKRMCLFGFVVGLIFLMVNGCAPIKKGMHNMTSEWNGTSSSGIGTDEIVPEERTYPSSYDKVWKAALAVFQKQNISILQKNKKNGLIITEKRKINEVSGFDRMVLITPEFFAEEHVEIDQDGKEVSIRYKATFTKMLSGMLSSSQKDSKAENALRKKFFEDMDNELGKKL